MNIVYEPTSGKLFDFLQSVVFGAGNISYKNFLEDRGLAPSPEVMQAHESIWEGLDRNTPGLQAYTAPGTNRDRLIRFYFNTYCWECKTIQEYIDRILDSTRNEMRYEILSYYDPEDKPIEYYRELQKDASRLHDFVFGLSLSDKLKFEILGIASGSEVYAEAMANLFGRLANRIEDVYRENEQIIDTHVRALQEKIKKEPFFMIDEYTEFADNYQKNKYNSIRVTACFLNSHIVYWKSYRQDLLIYLGIHHDTIKQDSFNSDLMKNNIFFKALSEETRVRIIDLLREKEMYIGEISRTLDVPLTTLTYHINMLQESNIIRCRYEGKKTYCIYMPSRFVKAANMLNYIASEKAPDKRIAVE